MRCKGLQPQVPLLQERLSHDEGASEGGIIAEDPAQVCTRRKNAACTQAALL